MGSGGEIQMNTEGRSVICRHGRAICLMNIVTAAGNPTQSNMMGGTNGITLIHEREE